MKLKQKNDEQSNSVKGLEPWDQSERYSGTGEGNDFL